jgi:hypothetical protein
MPKNDEHWDDPRGKEQERRRACPKCQCHIFEVFRYKRPKAKRLAYRVRRLNCGKREKLGLLK